MGGDIKEGEEWRGRGENREKGGRVREGSLRLINY